MPLYPAVQALRVSAPQSCQTIQSAASIQRSQSPHRCPALPRAPEAPSRIPTPTRSGRRNGRATAPASRRDGRDPIGLLLRRVVFPQLRVSVRPSLELRKPAERRTITEDGKRRRCGERRRNTDDLGRVDSSRLHGCRDRDREHLEPVSRILEGPRLLELRACARQHGVDHAVGVLVHRRPELLAVAPAHDERSSREGSEVDAYDEAVVVIGHP